MPTYRNETPQSITSSGETWKPKETKHVSFFVPDEGGLTLLSEEPRVENQKLASGKQTIASGETLRIYVPPCKAFILTVNVLSGLALIRENYPDNEIVTPVDGGGHFCDQQYRKYVEAYYVTGSGETAIAYHVSRAYD